MDDISGEEHEYRELLRYLFERHIRPRMPAIRERWEHRMHDEWSHQLAMAIRATRLLRFIESDCSTDEEVFRTFTPDKLNRTVNDVRYAEQFARRLIEQGGFEEVIEDHASEIAQGLSSKHLPNLDEAIMLEIGSKYPKIELRLIIDRARALLQQRTRHAQDRVGFLRRQDEIEKILTRAAEELLLEGVNGPSEGAKKSRRWFKGLGQIGQGAALTIANVGLAASIFHLPVSPETQTWGAITSVAAGIGSIANGVGDLRGE